MITVHVGTDTYGRVKVVSGTPIVTKFAMFQFLPVYPLQSLYLVKLGPSEATGVPLLMRKRTAAIQGIPLASVDYVSVLIAYTRAVFAAMVLVGALALVPGIMYLTGERLDDLALSATRGLLVSIAVGIVGGILSYAIPLTPRRERDIRRHCAELLGISADPARVPPDLSKAVVEEVQRTFPESKTHRMRLIRELIMTRASIAQGTGDVGLEAKTDDLLEQLRLAEHRDLASDPRA